MPRPHPPPTPGSSTELGGNEGGLAAPAFQLPPTAFQDYDRASNTSSTPSAHGSDSSYRPVSPSSPPDMSRKKPVTTQSESVITRDDFSLPPPPTRSRKIIQVQPKAEEQDNRSLQRNDASTPAQSLSAEKTPATGGKRKQNNIGSTAAGRKIARKTAHSLIERRRRSKMNEEFGVLKDMIPACKGQEMHKLAILQASIDYLRYLQQCVVDLQAQNNSPHPASTSRPAARVENNDEDEDDEDDEDEVMEDDAEGPEDSTTPATHTPQHSGSMVSLPPLSQITNPPTTSPSVFSMTNGRHHSISSASQSSYSPYFHSSQTSPAFGPQLHHISTPSFGNTLGLGSPALKPVDSASTLRHIAEGAQDLSERQGPINKAGRSERELDQEATTALLMLNHDRRPRRAAQDADSGRSGAGMSVRDLLSG